MLKQSLPYIIALVVFVLLFSLAGYPLLTKNNGAQNILAEKEKTLRQIYSSGGLPSDELIDVMERDNNALTDKYEELRKTLPTAEELSLPEGVNLPLFYLEELKNLKEKIKDKAAEKEIEILTENLGLPDILPSDEYAPQLIRNVYITETIAELLLEVGVNSIDAIELGAITRTDMYEDIPVILSVICDTPSFTKLLFTLENTNKGFFIVKDFSISSAVTEKREIQGSMSASREGDVYYGGSSSRRGPGGTFGIEPEKIKRIEATLYLSLIRWGQL